MSTMTFAMAARRMASAWISSYFIPTDCSILETSTDRFGFPKPPEGYQKDEENPLEGDVLIVDECSMIDIMLMYNLLKALPAHMTLIMVGDTDQLPSVGAGNVLETSLS